MNYISLVFRIVIISSLFFLIQYPFDKNPDYYNYYINYINQIDRFDIGYTITSIIMRDVMGIGFELHWNLLILIELVLIFLVYRNFPVLMLAIPNLVLMSQFFYGTQIRYAIASLVFVIALNLNTRSITTLVVSSLLHYGITIPSLLFGMLTDNITNILKNNRIKLLCFIICLIGVVTIIGWNIFSIIANTRFGYFTPNSEFTSTKSASSVFYILVYWVVMLVITQRNNVELDRFMLFSMLLITVVLATSSIAVLSGRLLLLFFIIEPFIAYRMLRSNENIILKLSPVILMLTKAAFMISSTEFH